MKSINHGIFLGLWISSGLLIFVILVFHNNLELKHKQGLAEGCVHQLWLRAFKIREQEPPYSETSWPFFIFFHFLTHHSWHPHKSNNVICSHWQRLACFLCPAEALRFTSHSVAPWRLSSLAISLPIPLAALLNNLSPHPMTFLRGWIKRQTKAWRWKLAAMVS